ncbi:restriction endonuclease [Corallococcus sp. AB045]|uniref:restriction endonuclease n=1 Tax=Corallococcus sp. AB045 TaxID=2316719 RepID=UPI000ECC6AD4|nr:restriction endonuclease [Corallococcus sp. AB045]RKH84119.1 restriction endonuclease [Corallococcus sp. AB045]
MDFEESRPLGALARKHVRFIEPLSQSLVTAEVLREINKNSGRMGVLVAGDVPTFYFLVDGTFRPDEDFMFYSYGWETDLGAVLTITLFWKAGFSCVAVQPTHEAFSSLVSGVGRVVIVRGDRCVAALAVELARQPDFQQQWSAVAGHVPLMVDERAALWLMFDHHPSLRARATPQEKLALGWAKEYRRALVSLNDVAEKARGAPSLVHQGRSPPESFRPLAEITARPDWGVKDVLDAIRAIQGSGGTGFLSFIAANREFDAYAHEASGHAHCVLKLAATEAFLLCTELTAEGAFLPWLDLATGEIRLLQIDPQGFPGGFPVEEYWARQLSALHVNTGRFVGGVDVPMDLRPGSTAWQIFPFSDKPEQAEVAADALIDEALVHRVWAIEPGAIFELQVGPFSHFQAWEYGVDVCFVARGKSGEYLEIALDTREKRVVCNGFGSLDPETDKAARAHAALKLLLASLFRDFLVVEERERVFRSVLRHSRPGKARGGNGEEPVVVYLPRVKYVGEPSIDACVSDLGQEERRAHYVRAHLRRAEHPSEHQRVLGQRYGFAVPENYTFVRPHERGDKERSVIYRSRSALLSLYEVNETRPAAVGGVEWFKFERDVKRLMEQLGFDVQHVSASRRGDRGVDVYATRGELGGDKQECWVVQCKCYAEHRKVGPAILRELLGAMRAYPVGVRGMVATTSSFTAESRRLARTEGLRLLDGEEFLRLTRHE